MATKGYKYRRVSNFPQLQVGQELTSVHQPALELDEAEDSTSSTIRFIGESDNPLYYKYHVKHESIRRMKVRVGSTIRNSVIAIVEFHLYLSKDGNHLYADTKSDYCHELLVRLSRTVKEFKFAWQRVDLVRLRQELSMRVKGGWFKNLQIADVRAAALYGANVGESEEWIRYEGSGQISALILEFDHNSDPYSVEITSDGGIVLYDDFSESESLELIEGLRNVIDQFVLSTQEWTGQSKKA